MKTQRYTIPICPYCGKESERATGAEIYPHRPDLNHKRFYRCEPCEAYVGCYEDGKPLGRLANAELRRAKQRAHAAFDPLWQRGRMSRSDAYTWLAAKLDLPKKETHIGMFDVPTCQRVVDLAAAFRKTAEISNTF